MMSALLLTACTAGRLDTQETAGRISVELKTDMPVKSVLLTEDEAADYHISVLDAEGNAAVYEETGEPIPVVDYKDFVTVTVPLNSQYQVNAESCTVEESEAGYGCARYEGGSGLFTLNASNIYQKAVIECSQSNALVTVVFDASVSERFTGLKVTLTSGARTLEIGEASEPVDTYFTPAELDYTVTGVYTETSFPVEIQGEALQLEAKDNIRLVVRLDLTHGQVDTPSVSVKEEYASEEEADCVIDPYL